MKFGDHLRQARLQKGVTQRQVADNFYVTRQTISSWENETTYPDIINLINLSDYYHISLDELLKEDSGMQEYLKKQDVLKSIKPISIVLLIIDLLFLGVILLQILNVIQLSNEVKLILDIFILLNIIALIQMTVLQTKFGAKTKINLTSNKLIIIGIIFLILGAVLPLISNLSLIGGISFGIGITSLLLNIFARKTLHNKQ